MSSTLRLEPPMIIDFTEYLSAKGVYIPNARIKVYTVYFQGARKMVPGYCHYYLGDQDFKAQSQFAEFLRNFAEPPQDAFARDNWFYNQASFAANSAVEAYQERLKNEQAT